jgi:hypothetical protein
MTDTATMRKISYWRYSAVNLKTLFAALACALLVFSMLGCGTTNHLQSITLTPASGGSGLFNVKGIGGTLQLVATGNYSSGKTKNLTSEVTYSVVPDPTGQIVPPAPPSTVTMSPTGLMTAVEPAICLWTDTTLDLTKPPTWALTGDYIVTASFQGVTSQQAFVAVASAVGNGPGGACGP